jgi:hypothetical protein
LEEGLFHPDGLDDDGVRLVRRYARAARPAVDRRRRDHNPQFMARTRAEFVERVLFRAGWQNGATIGGYNLVFDLSRLALRAGRGRSVAPKQPGGRPRGNPGAVTLQLWDGRRDRYRPRVIALPGDAGVLLPWGAVERPPEADLRHVGSSGWQGRPAGDHFLDLAQLVYVLTGQHLALVAACAKAGVPYTKPAVALGKLSAELIDYCRADVGATARLAEAIL